MEVVQQHIYHDRVSYTDVCVCTREGGGGGGCLAGGHRDLKLNSRLT